MKTKDYLKKYKKMSMEELSVILKEKASIIYPVLTVLSGRLYGASAIYNNFILASIGADGKVTDKEISLLSNLSGEKINKQDIEVLIKNNEQDQRVTKDIVKLVNLVSSEIKEDLLVFAICFLVVDGITVEEENYFDILLED